MSLPFYCILALKTITTEASSFLHSPAISQSCDLSAVSVSQSSVFRATSAPIDALIILLSPMPRSMMMIKLMLCLLTKPPQNWVCLSSGFTNISSETNKFFTVFRWFAFRRLNPTCSLHGSCCKMTITNLYPLFFTTLNVSLHTKSINLQPFDLIWISYRVHETQETTA